MNATVRKQTNEKFTCNCLRCGSNDVSFNVRHILKNEYGETTHYERFSLRCNTCKSEWAEVY